MNDPRMSSPIRENSYGWTTIVSGDNDVEILEYKIKAENFAQAAEVATKMAPIVVQYESLDSEYSLRVNLTRWGVEARLTVPTGHWESEAQEKLAKGIAELRHQAES